MICVVFVCEAAALAAAIGNQQFFWWIFLILTFLLPYGMVVAELGTTYDGDGGIYDWVRDGLGDKWGARISYYYWVNYPLWIASLATMFPDILGMVFGVEFNIVAKMGIELILAIVATLVPFSADEFGDKVPMIVIFIVLVLIGEVVRIVSAKGRKEEYKGLTPELAAQRLAEEAEAGDEE